MNSFFINKYEEMMEKSIYPQIFFQISRFLSTKIKIFSIHIFQHSGSPGFSKHKQIGSCSRYPENILNFLIMVVISSDIYQEIISFIRKYDGLSIDCEEKLKHVFNDIPGPTLGSIVSKEGQIRLKINHSKISARAGELLNE